MSSPGVDDGTRMEESSFDLTAWLDADARAAFGSATRRRRVASGQIIYLQGDHGREMYRIERGSVRLSLMRPEGREVVLLMFQAGDCFGTSSMVGDPVRPHTAEAVTAVELSVLDTPAFNHLRAHHRSFDDALLRLLSAQMRSAIEHFVDRNLDDLHSRVISRLLASLQAEPRTKDALAIELSQNELALMVGASRQHVNRVLRKLEGDGLISLTYRRIDVLDRVALQNYFEAISR